MSSKGRKAVHQQSGRAMPPRWKLLLAGAAIAIAGAVILSGTAWPILLSMLVLEGLYVSLWGIAMAGIGDGILRCGSRKWLDDAPRSLYLATIVALGIGATSLLVLLLGLSGVLSQYVSWAIVVAGVLLAYARGSAPQVRSAVRSWLVEPAGGDAALLLLALPAAIVLSAACVMPGALWKPEPSGYDIVEYHLQIPREWYEIDRIVPLAHNVFSYFPFNVEMHYLLAMHLRGGPWKGMYLAQFMNVGIMSTFVLAVYGALRSRGRGGAVAGALLASATPWTTLLAPIAYNESGFLLFGTLCIVWALRGAANTDGSGRRRFTMLAVAGVFAGFAIGSKLTAAPLVAAAVPVCLLSAGIRSSRRLLAPLLLFCIACVLAASPWLVRNTVWAGNPLFPEAQSLFGGPFSKTQQERWSVAHSASASQRPIVARVTALVEQVFVDIEVQPSGVDHRAFFGLLLLPSAIVVFLIRFRDPQLRTLGLLMLWLTVFWLAFTHLQARFFVLAIPLAAIAIGSIYRPNVRTIVTAVILLTTLPSYVTIIRRLESVVAAMGVDDASSMMTLAVPDGDIAGAIESSDRPLVLAGDAMAFIYPLPKGRVFYRTVFDVDAKDGESVIDAWTRGMPKDAMILVSPSELERFHKTYVGIPEPANLQSPGPYLIRP